MHPRNQCKMKDSAKMSDSENSPRSAPHKKTQGRSSCGSVAQYNPSRYLTRGGAQHH